MRPRKSEVTFRNALGKNSPAGLSITRGLYKETALDTARPGENRITVDAAALLAAAPLPSPLLSPSACQMQAT